MRIALRARSARNMTGLLFCAAIALAAPIALAGCALDTTDDSAVKAAHHEVIVPAGDQGTSSQNNGAKGSTDTQPPPPQPEPSPWHQLTPRLEPEPSPWGGSPHAGTTDGMSGGSADKATLSPQIYRRELLVDQLQK